ncbi:MAG: hypothetical protein ACLPYS_20010 [Vulcanimicrobiaceae bacterium]
MKRLIIFAKDKGGTGASFVARFLAELHEEKGTGALLVDGDGTTASLSKHFGEPKATNPTNPVRTFGLHGAETDRDTIANLLEEDAATIVLDLPATALTVLRKIEQEYGWTEMIAERGFRPTIVASITPFEDSIFDLRDAIDLFGPNADYVAVINLGMAEERADFALWDNGETRRKFHSNGNVEVVFPRLKPRVAAILAKEKLTFEQGKKTKALGPADRARLARWAHEAETALVPAAERLGLP